MSKTDFLNRSPEVIAIVVALGIGLLIGLELERRKGEGPGRSPAELRTFAAASLAGTISVMGQGPSGARIRRNHGSDLIGSLLENERASPTSSSTADS